MTLICEKNSVKMNKIEMSLDDIIKNSKDIKNFNRRGRGGSRGTRGSVGGRDRIRRTSGGPSFKRSPARRSASAGGRPFTRSPVGEVDTDLSPMLR